MVIEPYCKHLYKRDWSRGTQSGGINVHVIGVNTHRQMFSAVESTSCLKLTLALLLDPTAIRMCLLPLP